MLHYLRIAVTALSLTACVLLIALWVRSYRWEDYLSVNLPGSRVFIFHSWIGGTAWRWERDEMPKLWNKERMLIAPILQDLGGVPPDWTEGFVGVLQGGRGVVVPYFALVTVFAFVAAAPWIDWSQSFSLRTLLIATTLIAVGLGVVIWAAK
jgi:hypothetical protein